MPSIRTFALATAALLWLTAPTFAGFGEMTQEERRAEFRVMVVFSVICLVLALALGSGGLACRLRKTNQSFLSRLGGACLVASGGLFFMMGASNLLFILPLFIFP